MAVTNAVVAVGSSATALNTAVGAGQPIYLRATSAGVFVGPSTVTTANGTELPNGTIAAVNLDPGDVLYAIHATSANVQVLRT